MILQKNSILRNSRGMTLVEILIVLAIVGSMMALIGGRVMDNFQKAKRKETNIILSQVANALTMYSADCGKYPSSLTALIEDPGKGECSNWDDAYVKKDQLKDAWGHDLVYELEGSSFYLKSHGKDGREGGTKIDKDIIYDDREGSEK